MIQRYVVLANDTVFGPLAARVNVWKFREAVGANGMSYGVWKGPSIEPEGKNLAIGGHCYAFRNQRAAELEHARCETLKGSGPSPRLYAVSAWTLKGAMRAVLDQVYGAKGGGAERLQ